MGFTNQGVNFKGGQFCPYQTHTVVLTTDPRNQDTPGGGLKMMNHQAVELSVWLGIAILALIFAGLSLWRVRRLLNPIPVHVSQGRLVPSALAEETSLVRAP